MVWCHPTARPARPTLPKRIWQTGEAITVGGRRLIAEPGSREDLFPVRGFDRCKKK